MSEYPGATPPFPELAILRNEFSDQAESEAFRNATLSLCHKTNISIQELVGFTIGYLHGRNSVGVEDLAEFMTRLIAIYHLEHQPDSSELYEAVKGIPGHSEGRIGYTFQRRRQGTDRGVFLFLR